ncbi:hypothetical protein FP026_07510 [Rhizobium tropici]|uniref:MFS transporter n=1 Tax=Rhizobium tropici TaxID=398 RepID=A0A5B0WAF6_RHITR|nr:hypothetical protein [Rhizobium tropici]KAA1183863.1 hypothetical protein FP026_07510 [Rhizobium tropici]
MAAAALLLATTQYLPQVVLQNLSHSAASAGLMLSPGVAAIIMMFVVGFLSSKVPPKYLIAIAPSWRILHMPLDQSL